jgi:hypothetical protein
MPVTADEWLTATDPEPMLDFARRLISDRKLRLFAVACCRRVWQRLNNEQSRTAVELAERAADQTVDDATIRSARRAAENAISAPASWAAFDTLDSAAVRAALDASHHAAWAVPASPRSDERRAQAALLRDIIDISRRPSTDIRTDLLAWREGCLLKLAREIYEDYHFDRLPLLADALEDAGCTDAEMLDHLRGAGPHVRGCWALDLVLGKS